MFRVALTRPAYHVVMVHIVMLFAIGVIVAYPNHRAQSGNGNVPGAGNAVQVAVKQAGNAVLVQKNQGVGYLFHPDIYERFQ